MNARPEAIRRPLRSKLSVGEAKAEVVGALPGWLRGELIRTCPAVFESNGWQAEHWFDGLGALFAFSIGEQGVGFRQRLLETSAVVRQAGGDTTLSTFGTTSRRPIWKRLNPFGEIATNANVNCQRFGDELWAMTETPRPVRVDPVTLAAKEEIEWKDELPRDLLMLAHPLPDFERGVIVNVGTALSRRSELVALEYTPGSRTRRVIARWPCARAPYQHAFGLSPSSVVMVAHPFDVDPLTMLFSQRGYIDHFRFRPEAGTTMVRVDRASGAIREHRAPPMFVFHTINTFEEGDATVIDLLAYDDASIVEQVRLPALLKTFPPLLPQALRLRLVPGKAEAEVERLGANFEFPGLDLKRDAGRPTGVVFGATGFPGQGEKGAAVVRFDAKARVMEHAVFAGWAMGEPLLVRAPEGDADVLITVGSHLEEDRTALFVLDSRNLETLARCEVPLPVPLGFHGTFVRA